MCNTLLMFRNATPRKLAIYVGLLSSVFVLLVLVILFAGRYLSIPWWGLILVPSLFFIFIYNLVFFILKKYIYRKVKLIYKNIHQHKRKGKNLELELPIDSDVLSTVERDVSDWAASQAEEIESLRSMEEYRRNFLGNISHELKTPLFNMQGYLFTLAEGGLYDANINTKYLNRALVNVKRLQTIVDDLEIISKLESGKIMLDLTVFPLKELIKECIEDHKMLADTKSIDIVLKNEAEVNFKVKGDRENIRQVLNNLIVNSIKYGKEKGRTRISCYNMETYILVEVQDNGIGIGQDDLKHVFDRFYRADKTGSRDMGGSGLGLSIVKHIIEAHQQTITVSSQIGEGAIFGFTLEKA